MEVFLLCVVFVGFVNLKENLASKKEILISMNESLQRRGPDECGYFTSDNALLRSQKIDSYRPRGWKTTNEF